MINCAFIALIGFSVCGFVLSLAVHFGALAGFEPPDGSTLVWVLSGGMFALLIPAIAAEKIMPDKILPDTVDTTTNNDWFSWLPKWFPRFQWFIWLPKCPVWMNYVTGGLTIYILVIFTTDVLTHLLVSMKLLRPEWLIVSMSYNSGEGDPSIASWRGISAVLMLFYWSFLATFASARRTS
jgi:hypothetical protein